MRTAVGEAAADSWHLPDAAVPVELAGEEGEVLDCYLQD